MSSKSVISADGECNLSETPCCLCWLGCFLLFFGGELIFDLFLTSSYNLTATVESNAATEEKKT